MAIPEYDLTGKVAFITGAGRGICKGIAEVFAEAGADLAINSRTSKYLDPTAAEISRATGRRVLPVAADLTDPREVQRSVDRVMAEYGRIDILVNGVGDSLKRPIVPRPGTDDPKQPVSDSDLHHIMDLNLTHAITCTRAVAPQMLERNWGRIINISGIGATKGGNERVLYSTAKMAIIGFTRSQAFEWAKTGVRVNAIAPGLFPDFSAPEAAGERMTEEQYSRIVPMGRPGKFREVGLLALYLASPASDYMIGQTLFIDGGMSI
jgi:NAD(P)-dependent dehydrogenase (short-subunit alcohol dehydrogenase family)